MITKSENKKGPAVLLVLDGWGIAKKSKANAIELAKKSNFDTLWKENSHTTLKASGHDAGLPKGQPGNSEAGHMNIGAGRILEQDSVVINREIQTGQFQRNAAFIAAAKQVRAHKSDLHLMGLLSDGESPHSNPEHLYALIAWARTQNIKNVYLHLFTDGRDSLPHSSLKLVSALMRFLKNTESKDGKKRSGEWIASLMGRFYAMDRKKDWDRTEMAYNAMVLGQGIEIRSPQAAITQSYNRDETDEYIRPYVFKRNGDVIGKIKDNDAVIFFNLRSDRARQLAKPFVQPGFNKKNPGSFKRKKVLKNLTFVALTDFGPDLDSILTAYPSPDVLGTLPMALKDKKQLYIAEKEKFAHVTYFFNGGYADPVAGEDRKMINSPDVESYDLVPCMSTKKIVDEVLRLLPKYDFVTINFAIPDMVAHTGNLEAGIKAVECADLEIGRLYKALQKIGGSLFITADHGNADKMVDLKTGEMYTEHTVSPVPFIMVEPKIRKRRLRSGGRLGDIAPTILEYLEIEQPKEMTGKSLL